MKKLFICIYLLTVFDAAATSIGVKAGYLREANPLLNSVFKAQPAVACIGICLFVCLLLLVLYKVRNRIWWLNYALSGILLVKLAVFCVHLQIFFKIS